nr:hypothetical protein [Micrococcus sp. CH3]
MAVSTTPVTAEPQGRAPYVGGETTQATGSLSHRADGGLVFLERLLEFVDGLGQLLLPLLLRHHTQVCKRAREVFDRALSMGALADSHRARRRVEIGDVLHAHAIAQRGIDRGAAGQLTEGGGGGEVGDELDQAGADAVHDAAEGRTGHRAHQAGDLLMRRQDGVEHHLRCTERAGPVVERLPSRHLLDLRQRPLEGQQFGDHLPDVVGEVVPRDGLPAHDGVAADGGHEHAGMDAPVGRRVDIVRVAVELEPRPLPQALRAGLRAEHQALAQQAGQRFRLVDDALAEVSEQ